MSETKQRVPSPPSEQIVIAQEDLNRLAKWVEFFQKLSPRVRLIPHTAEKNLNRILAQAEELLRQIKVIEPDYKLIGWPQQREVAFVLCLDSSPPRSGSTACGLNELYFFCFGGRAFTPTHFTWDGEDETTYHRSYSLNSFSDDLLSWNFIACELVVSRLKEFEQRVPKLKKPKTR